MLKVGNWYRLKAIYGGSMYSPAIGDVYVVTAVDDMTGEFSATNVHYGFEDYFKPYELTMYFEPHVPQKPVHMLSFDDMAALVKEDVPAKCTCGAAAVNHPGHSSWCDVERQVG